MPPLWNKVKQELDRAGRVAQTALDEGRMRLEGLRARQRADRAAQALGYAIYHARSTGGDLATDVYAHLSSEIAAAEADVDRLGREGRDTGERRAPGW